jgi:hypothetical protein
MIVHVLHGDLPATGESGTATVSYEVAGIRGADRSDDQDAGGAATR